MYTRVCGEVYTRYVLFNLFYPQNSNGQVTAEAKARKCMLLTLLMMRATSPLFTLAPLQRECNTLLERLAPCMSCAPWQESGDQVLFDQFSKNAFCTFPCLYVAENGEHHEGQYCFLQFQDIQGEIGGVQGTRVHAPRMSSSSLTVRGIEIVSSANARGMKS
jgi:hypothetical protein